MNRRQFLECAAILASGTAVGRLAFALTPEQQAYLAEAPDWSAGPVGYLTDPQRRIVAAMAEVVIPRTDTPGAIDAGVPRFIERMAGEWLNEQERGIFDAGVRDMETRIPAETGKPFDELDAAQQLRIMEDLEDAASDSAWYSFGQVLRDFVSDAPFVCQIKELTVWGFLTSEVGAKEFLRFNYIPGRFDGDLELDPEASEWVAWR